MKSKIDFFFFSILMKSNQKEKKEKRIKKRIKKGREKRFLEERT